METMADRATQESGRAEQLYRVIQAVKLLQRADWRDRAGAPFCKVLYSRIETAYPYDVELLENVYLPCHEDPDTKQFAESVISDIRDEDSKLI